ncbi:hypothetical protein [Nocardioides daejeonensis]|uniref:hypothetical protein n=1 Tax=Nocardioides daejeonensis TaxID=1046556 RepID=UPI000D74710C|nr:hypothetical protein [Nocardioides daejeonensis]
MHRPSDARRRHLGRLAVCGALVAMLTPLTAASGPAATAATTTTATSSQAGDPPGTTYRYRGTFTAKVSHAVYVSWGGGDSEDRIVEATIAGTIPDIRMSGRDMIAMGPTGARTSVTSASGEGMTRTNSGRYIETCEGSSGTASGKPMLLPYGPDGRNALTPFALLTVPASCVDSDGRSGTRKYRYGPLSVSIWDERVGTERLEIPFHEARGVPPLQGADTCPGYIEGQTPVCEYVIEGTLALELVKKEPPASTKAPRSRAKVGRGARKATARVTCPTGCSVTIRLTPLTGGPSLAVPSRRRRGSGADDHAPRADPAGQASPRQSGGRSPHDARIPAPGRQHLLPHEEGTPVKTSSIPGLPRVATRLLTATTLVATLLTAGAAASDTTAPITAPITAQAGADGTITYVKGDDVWVARADGSQPRRVTTDGTAARPWRSPTEADNGTIVAGRGNLIYRMDQWGTVLTTLDPPDIANSAGELLGGAPAHLAVSPDGRTIAYTYERYSCPLNAPCRVRHVTAFTSATTMINPDVWGVTYYDNPSWITNTRVAVNADLIDNINLFDLGRGLTHWFDEDDYTTDDQPLFDFEVARHAAYATAIRNSADRAHVVFYRVRGNYRSGGRPPIPEGFCATTPVNGISSPTLSADGELGAWQEPDGIWMIQLGVTAPCTIEPALVVAGGSQPSYSPAALQTSRPETRSFVVRKTPRITGRVKVGAKLRVTAPVMAPAPTSLTYQWLRGTAAIKGATGSTYKVTARDRGKAIRVRVTARRPQYAAKAVVSPAVRIRR